MTDVWTKKGPDDKTITEETVEGTGFRITTETWTAPEEHKAATDTVQFVAKCPHCGIVLAFDVVQNRDEIGHYSVECSNPDCKKPSMRLLPGKIVSGRGQSKATIEATGRPHG